MFRGSHRNRFVLMLLYGLLAARAAVADETRETQTTPRGLYNDGTAKFRAGKLQEAEACLQAAVASQVVSIQPPALYNLGEVRFQQGAEQLKKGPSSHSTEPASQRALNDGEAALKEADAALAGDDVSAMVAAYIQGKGTRKELKAATEAVKKAMDSYGAVLAKWRRASGDFKSAFELNPADADAQTNGDLVDRYIAKLVDMQKMLNDAMQGMQGKREALGEKMKALKKKMPPNPGGDMKGQGEGDDDDEDEDKPPKGPQEGDQEPGPKNGKEMILTQEEAARLLDLLKLDANRKLPLGGTNEGKPGNRKGRDW
jgi:tetratricopeptide (TPR) repeat protein